MLVVHNFWCSQVVRPTSSCVLVLLGAKLLNQKDSNALVGSWRKRQ
uniref:Uncharacterized protein n=1 Tax=Arundo donax TaxID=35708 RepID=A0A0A9DJD9_ARUDO